MKPKTEIWNLILVAVLVAITVGVFFLNLPGWFVVGKKTDTPGMYSAPLKPVSSSYRIGISPRFSMYRTA